MSDTTAGRRSVHFRADEFDRLVGPLGYTSVRAQARFLGVSPSAMSKIRRRENPPSNEFIAAVQTALPNVPLERLFEVVETQGSAA